MLTNPKPLSHTHPHIPPLTHTHTHTRTHTHIHNIHTRTHPGHQMAFCAHELRSLIKAPRGVDLHAVAARLDAGLYQSTGTQHA